MPGEPKPVRHPLSAKDLETGANKSIPQQVNPSGPADVPVEQAAVGAARAQMASGRSASENERCRLSRTRHWLIKLPPFRPLGEIGRHARLRILCRKASGFDSPSGHYATHDTETTCGNRQLHQRWRSDRSSPKNGNQARMVVSASHPDVLHHAQHDAQKSLCTPDLTDFASVFW